MRHTAIMDAALPFDTPAVAADKAWRRMCMAVDAGRSVEALRWLSVFRAVQALVVAEPPAPEPVQTPVLLTPPSFEVEKVESVFPDSHPATAETRDPAPHRSFRPP